MIPALALTYLGTILCYAASPKSRGTGQGQVAGFLHSVHVLWVRVPGVIACGLGLGGFLVLCPIDQGILIWLSALMLNISAIVIFAPLFSRFLTISTAISLASLAFSPWF